MKKEDIYVSLFLETLYPLVNKRIKALYKLIRRKNREIARLKKALYCSHKESYKALKPYTKTHGGK